MNESGYSNPPVDHQFKPGTSGNPNGRKKGSKNLSTIIRELEDEDFDWSVLPLNESDWFKKCGSPWKAIVFAITIKALGGDVRAADWLRKSAYGNSIENEEGFFSQRELIISVVNPRVQDVVSSEEI